MGDTDDRSELSGKRLVDAAPRRVRRYGLLTLRRRLILLNGTSLILFVAFLVFLVQQSESVVDAHRKTAIAQAQAIAHAIAHTALVEAQEEAGPTAIAPKVGSVKRRHVTETVLALVDREHMRLIVYDTQKQRIADSQWIFDQIERRELKELGAPEDQEELWAKAWRTLRYVIDRIYLWDFFQEKPDLEEKFETAMEAADKGQSTEYIDWWTDDQRMLNAFAPISPVKANIGVVHLQESRVDRTILAMQSTFGMVILVSGVMTVLGLWFLGRFIATPVRRLAEGADAITLGKDERAKIPDYSDRGDEIGGLSEALRDMTAALNDRIESNARFAADVAHEIKNPLTSLRSAVETFELAKTDDIREKLISVITSDVGRIDRLISDISNAGRVEAEMARENLREIDVNKLLSGLVDFYAQTQSDSGVKLTFNKTSPGDLPVVLGRGSKLGQVFRNLIDNAVSFSRDGDEVRLAAGLWDEDRRFVKIVVEDDGPGIPEENLESIFERFYTERPQAEEFGKHSGLGLSICRQIVEAHGGRISAENRLDEDSQVIGARFVVLLPTEDVQ